MKNLILVILVISTLVLGILLVLSTHQNQKLTTEIEALSDQLLELESISGLKRK
jgi:cell division protein FtsL